MSWLNKLLPKIFSGTLALRYFGFRKIPLLFFCRPALIVCDKNQVLVSIALKRRTKNHLGSMYFGVLCVGADCAAGLIAMNKIKASGKNISLIFKSLSVNFFRRAEGDVFFSCVQGREIATLVASAIETGERVELPVTVIATVPSISDEVVAEFVLVLSLKFKHN